MSLIFFDETVTPDDLKPRFSMFFVLCKKKCLKVGVHKSYLENINEINYMKFLINNKDTNF